MTDTPTLVQKLTLPSGQIEIPLSQSKLVKLIAVSLIFVICGLWLVAKPPAVSNPIFGNPKLIFIVGISSVLLFGLMLILLIKKLFDKKPGLTISDNGIRDNIGIFSAGFIPWGDIVEIQEMLVQKRKMINVVVQNPQDYINKQKNPLTKKFLQMNYNASGMVIGISDISLLCDYSELKALLNKKLAEFIRDNPLSDNENLRTVDLEQAAEITREIIDKLSFTSFLPTLIIPQTKHVVTSANIPPTVSHEEAAKDLPKKEKLEHEEYFLAFKISDREIKIEHHKLNGTVESIQIADKTA